MIHHMTAGAVVIDTTTARVLLILPKDEAPDGKLRFPEHHLTPSDRPHEVALRAAEQQAGITATLWGPPTSIPGVIRHPQPMVIIETMQANHQHTTLLYAATADSSQPPLTKPDQEITVWHSVVYLGDDVEAHIEHVTNLARLVVAYDQTYTRRPRRERR
jgi:hypothetical protein